MITPEQTDCAVANCISSNMQRGKKQSPFIGRRVPLVDEGVPILYKRYTSVAEIVIDGPGSKKRAEPENGHAEPKEQQQSGEQQQQQDQQHAPPAKKSKKEKKQQQQQQQQQEQRQPEPELLQLAAAAIDPEAAALAQRRALKAAKKEEKKKRKAAEREQAAAAAAAAAAADGAQASEGQAAEAAAEQEDKGNAEEAAKLRSVLGFTAAAAAAPAAAAKAPPPSSSQFAFGFSNLSSLSPAERVAAETEAKLAAITAVTSADKDGFVPRRVFVGGMPYSYSREEVAEYWSWCGTIESLDMLTFPDSGRFRGIAFITFETQEGADAALGCNGEQLDGQTLKVDRCKAAAAAKQMKAGLTSSSRGASQQQQQQEQQQQPLAPQPADGASAAPAAAGSAGGGPGKTPGYNVAYVGNIAFEAGPADISALFADCGVTKVRLHTDKASGKSKGYAHVHFGDASGLDKAIAKSGTEMHGRCIKVSYGQPKKA